MTERSQLVEAPVCIATGWPAAFVAVCTVVFGVSVAATVYFCRSMAGGMEMPGGWMMSMMWMRMPGQTWAGAVAMFLMMWLAMMVAMMLPSALPMLLSYRRALRTAGETRLGLPTVLMAGGYFAVWTAVGGLIYPVGVTVAWAAMRWPGVSAAMPAAAGVSMILAGMMQFTSWKMAGLCSCRDPRACAARACGGRWDAWRGGQRQGVNCAICCSGLMLAMLVLGAMDVTVMVVVAMVIAMEKVVSRPEWVVRISGAAAVVLGTAMIVHALQ
jgi:predicted metal-binding membrane protein